MIFTKSLLQSDVLSYWVILLLHQIIIYDKISNEKLQYELNREASKISALSSAKIGQDEYLTGEEILPSNQN